MGDRLSVYLGGARGWNQGEFRHVWVRVGLLTHLGGLENKIHEFSMGVGGKIFRDID